MKGYGCGVILMVIGLVLILIGMQAEMFITEQRVQRIERTLGMELTSKQVAAWPFGAEIPMPPSKLPKP